MTFEYLGREFIIGELMDYYSEEAPATYDILVVIEQLPLQDDAAIESRVVGYFYGANNYDKDEAIKIAKSYIDEFDQNAKESR